MATITSPSAPSAPRPAAGGKGLAVLWDRQLDHFPSDRKRYLSLAIVVLTTIVLYYELYLAGAVATSILTNLHMSFVFFVNITVIGYAFGAVASIVAGISDRYGRANIVTVGLLLTGLLSVAGIPLTHSKWSFAIVYIAIGFVEGIVLVATPALIRDFSPQLGRASAMGFWTLGPVLGSLVVSIVVTNTATHFNAWEDQYVVCGIAGLVVFAIALIGLRELSPQLRDQLMVSKKDRVLIEARAAGLDIKDTLKKPFRQMMHLDILGSAFAISVFLIIYYLAVGFFPTFFQTVFGYSQSEANGLGNWFWSFDAGALLLVGIISDRVRVRKPFMLVGAIGAIVATTLFALDAAKTPVNGVGGTSHTTFVILLILIASFLGMGFAPWMASFTETVERRNPALTATGLAVWGLTIRVVIALSVFFVPFVVTTVSTLVDKGPVVQGALADPTPVGKTTIGAVATAVAANPTVVAQVQAISARDGALIEALQKNPAVASAIAAGVAAGTTPTAAQLAELKAALGTPAYVELLKPGTTADLTYLSKTAPAKLGAANFAALSAPTPALTAALGTLQKDGPSVAKAAKASPKEWRRYFFVGVAGEVLFIPMIFVMAGFWDPRRAKRAEEEHEAMIDREIAALSA